MEEEKKEKSMERLWAPWRTAYILGREPEEEGCVLCNRSKAPPSERRELGVLRVDSLAYVIQNRYPYNGGHLMVVPVRHASSPLDLDEEEYAALNELVRVALGALDEALAPHGYNIGMNLGRVAGAGIADHCHIHIVPRWNGDTNFMPVLGETKVISEALNATYDRLFSPMQRERS